MRFRFISTVVAAVLMIPTIGSAQSCDSIGASFSGGWKQVESAPRDGTVVEMMQTYGVAPTYGLFRWSTHHMAIGQDGKLMPFESEASWVSVDNPGSGAMEQCLFWRPYMGKVEKYVDPTGGAQKSVAYWCAAAHRPYDKKTDRCK